MSDQRPDARGAFEAGLANEYFALSGLRASSIAEASTRATLFFTTLTGTVLALGFLASSTNAVVPVAYAALPIVILLGLLSFLRLVEISVEDVGALRAINRIRAYYGGLVPMGSSTSRRRESSRRSTSSSTSAPGGHRGRPRSPSPRPSA